MSGIVIFEEELGRLYAEFDGGGLSGVESFCIAHGLKEMAWVFGEGDFAVHAVGDFMVVDLLLDVEFGEFCGFADGG
jgi:hypothetical protein